MTAPSVEAVDQAAEIVDDGSGELRLRFPVLVIEGLDTSDGRYISPGALAPRALPLSLLAQPESSHGGDEPGPAVVVGRLDTVERIPGPQVVSRRTGEPFPEGTFVWTASGTMDADHPVADLVRRGYLRGVSVDLAGMDYEMVGEDGFVDDEHPRRQLVTHGAEIAAATLVPIPAFGDAYAELDGEPEAPAPVAAEDLPEGLLASAVPAWRSPEVGDLVSLAAAGDDTGTSPDSDTAGGSADDGLPVRIPPTAVQEITQVIDSGEQRDAEQLATAILEHIALNWALTEPVTAAELPDTSVTAAGDATQVGEGGLPEDPQQCFAGPEPAVRSLVFADGDMYVPTCAEHEKQAMDELAAAGETVDEVVDIDQPDTAPPAVTAAADEPHTGGMIALVPANPDELAVDGGDPVDELHLTLAYLGDDVTGWDDTQRGQVLDAARRLAESIGAPVEAEVMGHAAFNPTGAHDREPCAVYLVSGPDLPVLKSEVASFDASDHPVFLPHVTAGYGIDPGALSFVGPVAFSALRVALGEDVHDFPLGDPAGPGSLADQAADMPDADDEVGLPDAAQPCQYGPEPAVMSLLYGGGQRFVPVCAAHEEQARDQITAAGDTVTGVVDIDQPDEADATEETPA